MRRRRGRQELERVDDPVAERLHLRVERGRTQQLPIATTKVVCTATDSHGNTASATFTVTVRGARAQIRDLEGKVAGSPSLANAASLKKLLLKELDAADDDLVRDRSRSACMDIAKFSDTVERNTKPKGPIAKSESAQWLTDAARISAVIGCSTTAQL